MRPRGENVLQGLTTKVQRLRCAILQILVSIQYQVDMGPVFLHSIIIFIYLLFIYLLNKTQWITY